MPGPLLTLTVGEAARRGFWAGPLIIVGHALLELALVLLILAGLGVWLHRPLVLGLVGVGGAAMMGWMGLGCSRPPATATWVRPKGIGPPSFPGCSERRQSLAHLVAHHRPVYVMFSMKYGWLGVGLFSSGTSGRLCLVHPGVVAVARGAA
jgi:hypothetical protein